MKLVVTEAFGDYAKGAEITDAEAVEKALAEHPENVVRVADVQPETEGDAAK